jgi:hypothetical protein
MNHQKAKKDEKSQYFIIIGNNLLREIEGESEP